METTAADISGAPEPARYPNELQELTELYAYRRRSFYRIALSRLGNVADAEDAVQDAFLAAYKHLDQFKGQAQMSTWLTAILINATRMKVRRRPRQLHITLDGADQEQENHPLAETISDHQPTPEEVYQRREFEQRIARFSKQLQPNLRRTFQLRDVEGLSTRETAHFLGLREGTVKAQLRRARARIIKVVRNSVRKKRPAIRRVVS